MHSVCAMNVKDISSVKKKKGKILSVFIGNQILTGGVTSQRIRHVCVLLNYLRIICHAIVSLYMHW